MRFLKALIGALTVAAAAGASAQEIRIGLTGPQSGPAAFLGQHMKWGGELAVDDINAKGGVLGRKIRFVYHDSACRPADAVSSAERLLGQDNVDVMLGDLCSGPTMAVMPLIEKAGKPMVISISTSPEITKRSGVNGNKWAFRIVPDDEALTAAAAGVMQGYGKIALLAEDTDYGRASVQAIKAKLGASKFVSEDFVKPTENDFVAFLSKVRASNSDAIAVYVLDQQMLNLMKQYAQFGLKAPFIGRPPMVTPAAAELLKSRKFEGSWAVAQYYEQYHVPGNVAFAKAYKARFGENPHYVAYGIYEGVMVAADAIRRANSTDPDAVRKSLAATSYKGLLGNTLTFSAANQPVTSTVMRLFVKDGALQVESLTAN
jgi:branched-chain amino acid transport system substrate-binding protein